MDFLMEESLLLQYISMLIDHYLDTHIWTALVIFYYIYIMIDFFILLTFFWKKYKYLFLYSQKKLSLLSFH